MKLADHVNKKSRPATTKLKKNNPSDLIGVALTALAHARAPYSQFPVAAALLCTNGKIFSGVNIETSSFGLTICAERVAIFKAISEGETSFTDIAIITGSSQMCSPCGACRQVLWDLARDIRVILASDIKNYTLLQLSELLPRAFDDSSLLS